MRKEEKRVQRSSVRETRSAELRPTCGRPSTLGRAVVTSGRGATTFDASWVGALEVANWPAGAQHVAASNCADAS